MNLWDILILLAVAAMVVLAIRAIRSGRAGGCHDCKSYPHDCDACARPCEEHKKADRYH